VKALRGLVAGMVMAAATVVPSVGVAGAAGPTMTVTPSTGLGYHALVRLHLVGVAGSSGLVQQCFRSDATARCRDLAFVSFGDGPGVDRDVELVRRVDLGDGSRLDCNDVGTACNVALLTLYGSPTVPITFASTVPTLAAEPAPQVDWSREVDVDGRGFRPGEQLFVTQCAQGMHDFGLGPFPYERCFGVKHRGPVTVDAGGRFSTPVRIRRLVGVLDCAQAGVRCVARAVLAVPTYLVGPVDTPLAFVDDGRPIVEMPVSVDARESEGVAKALVTLRSPSASTVTVGYRTADDTATAAADYVPKVSHLVFRPGETWHVISIRLIDDTVPEVRKTFRIEFDPVPGAHRARPASAVVLQDGD
jgi:hypothetical protein